MKYRLSISIFIIVFSEKRREALVFFCAFHGVTSLGTRVAMADNLQKTYWFVSVPKRGKHGFRDVQVS